MSIFKLTRISIFLILFIITTSCDRNPNPTNIQKDNAGVVLSKPYLWKKSLHYGEPHTNGYTEVAIYYNNNIVINTTNGYDKVELSLINTDNGETIWDWDDRYQKSTESIEISHAHQYNNLLYYNNGGRHYCIDLNNGITKWKFRVDKTYSHKLTSYGKYFFCYSLNISNGHQEGYATKANIETGEFEAFFKCKLI